jgi:hypothetical protein
MSRPRGWFSATAAQQQTWLTPPRAHHDHQHPSCRDRDHVCAGEEFYLPYDITPEAACEAGLALLLRAKARRASPCGTSALAAKPCRDPRGRSCLETQGEAAVRSSLPP